jgi:hypothetical protein
MGRTKPIKTIYILRAVYIKYMSFSRHPLKEHNKKPRKTRKEFKEKIPRSGSGGL